MPTRATDKDYSELAELGANYLAKKAQIKSIEDEVSKLKTQIEAKMKIIPLESVGEHKQVITALADGTEILFQDQVRSTLSMVDDIIPQVRRLAGADAERFIVTEEVLLPNALENMVSMKILAAEDIEPLIVKKQSHSLIVKVNKKK